MHASSTKDSIDRKLTGAEVDDSNNEELRNFLVDKASNAVADSPNVSTIEGQGSRRHRRRKINKLDLNNQEEQTFTATDLTFQKLDQGQMKEASSGSELDELHNVLASFGEDFLNLNPTAGSDDVETSANGEASFDELLSFLTCSDSDANADSSNVSTIERQSSRRLKRSTSKLLLDNN